jgi:pilus assembly protein CpaB
MEARTAAARVPTETVMVALMDLPVGTELRADQLRAVDWPASSIPEGSFRDAKDLEGRMVAVRVYKGEPLMPALLTGNEAGKGLSALLPPGTRAAAVRVDDIVGVAGFIHPGDSVDVIVTMRTEGGTGATAARVILQAIKVLAVGKDLDAQIKGGDKAVPATVATLLVTADQSERLALAATQGKLLLTLRGSLDKEYVETKGVSPNSLLAATQPLPPQAPVAAKVARAPRVEAAPRPNQVVEILRGELFERRDFQKEVLR